MSDGKTTTNDADANREPSGLTTSRAGNTDLAEQMQRSIASYNISLDDLSEKVDAGLGVAVDKLTAIIDTSEEHEDVISAANALRGIGNHIVQRRKLSIDTVKKIVVQISPDLALDNAEAEHSQ